MSDAKSNKLYQPTKKRQKLDASCETLMGKGFGMGHIGVKNPHVNTISCLDVYSTPMCKFFLNTVRYFSLFIIEIL